MNVVIRNKLGLFVSTAEVEEAYSEIRSACDWIAEEYPEDARLSRNFAKMPEQRAIDLEVTMSERMNCNAAPLLHFVQRQIDLNNFNCAAACAIVWRDELRELTPYVSEKTRIWICEA